jgi:hypothetical protein
MLRERERGATMPICERSMRNVDAYDEGEQLANGDGGQTLTATTRVDAYDEGEQLANGDGG